MAGPTPVNTTVAPMDLSLDEQVQVRRPVRRANILPREIARAAHGAGAGTAHNAPIFGKRKREETDESVEHIAKTNIPKDSSLQVSSYEPGYIPPSLALAFAQALIIGFAQMQQQNPLQG